MFLYLSHFRTEDLRAKINIWGINNGTTLIYISDVAVEFDFGIYDLQETICGAIPAQSEAFLGSVDLKLPPNIVSSSQFNLRCRIYYLEDKQWSPGPILASQKFILNMLPSCLRDLETELFTCCLGTG